MSIYIQQEVCDLWLVLKGILTHKEQNNYIFTVTLNITQKLIRIDKSYKQIFPIQNSAL